MQGCWAGRHHAQAGARGDRKLLLCAPLQGYGAKINYEIAAPLLADISRTLRRAAESTDLPLQQARLMFAHCETLVPLASLMDLFRPSEQEVAEHVPGAHREGGWPGWLRWMHVWCWLPGGDVLRAVHAVLLHRCVGAYRGRRQPLATCMRA